MNHPKDKQKKKKRERENAAATNPAAASVGALQQQQQQHYSFTLPISSIVPNINPQESLFHGVGVASPVVSQLINALRVSKKAKEATVLQEEHTCISLKGTPSSRSSEASDPLLAQLHNLVLGHIETQRTRKRAAAAAAVASNEAAARGDAAVMSLVNFVCLVFADHLATRSIAAAKRAPSPKGGNVDDSTIAQSLVEALVLESAVAPNDVSTRELRNVRVPPSLSFATPSSCIPDAVVGEVLGVPPTGGQGNNAGALKKLSLQRVAEAQLWAFEGHCARTCVYADEMFPSSSIRRLFVENAQLAGSSSSGKCFEYVAKVFFVLCKHHAMYVCCALFLLRAFRPPRDALHSKNFPSTRSATTTALSAIRSFARCWTRALELAKELEKVPRAEGNNNTCFRSSTACGELRKRLGQCTKASLDSMILDLSLTTIALVADASDTTGGMATSTTDELLQDCVDLCFEYDPAFAAEQLVNLACATSLAWRCCTVQSTASVLSAEQTSCTKEDRVVAMTQLALRTVALLQRASFLAPSRMPPLLDVAAIQRVASTSALLHRGVYTPSVPSAAPLPTAITGRLLEQRLSLALEAFLTELVEFVAAPTCLAYVPALVVSRPQGMVPSAAIADALCCVICSSDTQMRCGLAQQHTAFAQFLTACFFPFAVRTFRSLLGQNEKSNIVSPLLFRHVSAALSLTLSCPAVLVLPVLPALIGICIITISTSGIAFASDEVQSLTQERLTAFGRLFPEGHICPHRLRALASRTQTASDDEGAPQPHIDRQLWAHITGLIMQQHQASAYGRVRAPSTTPHVTSSLDRVPLVVRGQTDQEDADLCRRLLQCCLRATDTTTVGVGVGVVQLPAGLLSDICGSTSVHDHNCGNIASAPLRQLMSIDASILPVPVIVLAADQSSSSSSSNWKPLIRLALLCPRVFQHVHVRWNGETVANFFGNRQQWIDVAAECAGTEEAGPQGQGRRLAARRRSLMTLLYVFVEQRLWSFAHMYLRHCLPTLLSLASPPAPSRTGTAPPGVVDLSAHLPMLLRSVFVSLPNDKRSNEGSPVFKFLDFLILSHKDVGESSRSLDIFAFSMRLVAELLCSTSVVGVHAARAMFGLANGATSPSLASRLDAATIEPIYPFHTLFNFLQRTDPTAANGARDDETPSYEAITPSAGLLERWLVAALLVLSAPLCEPQQGSCGAEMVALATDPFVVEAQQTLATQLTHDPAFVSALCASCARQRDSSTVLLYQLLLRVCGAAGEIIVAAAKKRSAFHPGAAAVRCDYGHAISESQSVELFRVVLHLQRKCTETAPLPPNHEPSFGAFDFAVARAEVPGRITTSLFWGCLRSFAKIHSVPADVTQEILSPLWIDRVLSVLTDEKIYRSTTFRSLVTTVSSIEDNSVHDVVSFSAKWIQQHFQQRHEESTTADDVDTEGDELDEDELERDAQGRKSSCRIWYTTSLLLTTYLGLPCCHAASRHTTNSNTDNSKRPRTQQQRHVAPTTPTATMLDVVRSLHSAHRSSERKAQRIVTAWSASYYTPRSQRGTMKHDDGETSGEEEGIDEEEESRFSLPSPASSTSVPRLLASMYLLSCCYGGGGGGNDVVKQETRCQVQCLKFLKRRSLEDGRCCCCAGTRKSLLGLVEDAACNGTIANASTDERSGDAQQHLPLLLAALSTRSAIGDGSSSVVVKSSAIGDWMQLYELCALLYDLVYDPLCDGLCRMTRTQSALEDLLFDLMFCFPFVVALSESTGSYNNDAERGESDGDAPAQRAAMKCGRFLTLVARSNASIAVAAAKLLSATSSAKRQELRLNGSSFFGEVDWIAVYNANAPFFSLQCPSSVLLLLSSPHSAATPDTAETPLSLAASNAAAQIVVRVFLEHVMRGASCGEVALHAAALLGNLCSEVFEQSFVMESTGGATRNRRREQFDMIAPFLAVCPLIHWKCNLRNFASTWFRWCKAGTLLSVVRLEPLDGEEEEEEENKSGTEQKDVVPSFPEAPGCRSSQLVHTLETFVASFFVVHRSTAWGSSTRRAAHHHYQFQSLWINALLSAIFSLLVFPNEGGTNVGSSSSASEIVCDSEQWSRMLQLPQLHTIGNCDGALQICAAVAADWIAAIIAASGTNHSTLSARVVDVLRRFLQIANTKEVRSDYCRVVAAAFVSAVLSHITRGVLFGPGSPSPAISKESGSTGTTRNEGSRLGLGNEGSRLGLGGERAEAEEGRTAAALLLLRWEHHDDDWRTSPRCRGRGEMTVAAPPSARLCLSALNLLFLSGTVGSSLQPEQPLALVVCGPRAPTSVLLRAPTSVLLRKRAEASVTCSSNNNSSNNSNNNNNNNNNSNNNNNNSTSAVDDELYFIRNLVFAATPRGEDHMSGAMLERVSALLASMDDERTDKDEREKNPRRYTIAAGSTWWTLFLLLSQLQHQCANAANNISNNTAQVNGFHVIQCLVRSITAQQSSLAHVHALLKLLHTIRALSYKPHTLPPFDALIAHVWDVIPLDHWVYVLFEVQHSSLSLARRHDSSFHHDCRSSGGGNRTIVVASQFLEFVLSHLCHRFPQFFPFSCDTVKKLVSSGNEYQLALMQRSKSNSNHHGQQKEPLVLPQPPTASAYRAKSVQHVFLRVDKNPQTHLWHCITTDGATYRLQRVTQGTLGTQWHEDVRFCTAAEQRGQEEHPIHRIFYVQCVLNLCAGLLRSSDASTTSFARAPQQTAPALRRAVALPELDVGLLPASPAHHEQREGGTPEHDACGCVLSSTHNTTNTLRPLYAAQGLELEEVKGLLVLLSTTCTSRTASAFPSSHGKASPLECLVRSVSPNVMALCSSVSQLRSQLCGIVALVGCLGPGTPLTVSPLLLTTLSQHNWEHNQYNRSPFVQPTFSFSCMFHDVLGERNVKGPENTSEQQSSVAWNPGRGVLSVARIGTPLASDFLRLSQLQIDSILHHVDSEMLSALTMETCSSCLRGFANPSPQDIRGTTNNDQLVSFHPHDVYRHFAPEQNSPLAYCTMPIHYCAWLD